MQIPRGERDTIITKLDTEDYWSVYTEAPSRMKQLRKLAATNNLQSKAVGDYGLFVMVPKSWVKISAPAKASLAQLAALQKAREAKGKDEEVG